MTTSFGNWFSWELAHGRSQEAHPGAPAATTSRKTDSVYVIAGRATPLLTNLAPYAPNLCAIFTEHNDVILKGHILDRALAIRAAAEIAAMPGVRHVYNWLYTDDQISDLITAALALDERTTWEMISVTTDHGTVTLRGVVASAGARAAAEEIARHAPFVRRVRNELVVYDTQASVGEEQDARHTGIAPLSGPTQVLPAERGTPGTHAPAAGRLSPKRRQLVA